MCSSSTSFCLFQRKNTNGLRTGRVLKSNSHLSSPNKLYYLTLQDDDNLVLYRGKNFISKNILWASNTVNEAQLSRPTQLRVQSDGNLVLYDSKNHVVWSTNTQGKGDGPYQLLVEDDGDVVLYDSTNEVMWSSNGHRIWYHSRLAPSRVNCYLVAKSNCLRAGHTLNSNSHLSSPNQLYHLKLQNDDNLVLYRSKIFPSENAQVIWSSNTWNEAPSTGPTQLKMQYDGNLVLYDSKGRPFWASNTYDHEHDEGSYKLLVEDDENVVVYNSIKKAVLETRGSLLASSDKFLRSMLGVAI
ncbi:unnamed protein product [Didymodactylos carnosus]|uniref:Bulb-type lectin domain-containing protein n=1 Tax=Didymodactylos carnosus TaxID=1234261 RepID=A0A8S2R265_9BILA|nr:unnamed protein product [Didymodactylos carnosus]CAF4126956.1 unnamed protein product [Didymodactylos carnosus]